MWWSSSGRITRSAGSETNARRTGRSADVFPFQTRRMARRRIGVGGRGSDLDHAAAAARARDMALELRDDPAGGADRLDLVHHRLHDRRDHPYGPVGALSVERSATGHYEHPANAQPAVGAGAVARSAGDLLR